MEYSESFRARPYSKRFVRHLDGYYAQSHPEEDFAETIATVTHRQKLQTVLGAALPPPGRDCFGRGLRGQRSFKFIRHDQNSHGESVMRAAAKEKAEITKPSFTLGLVSSGWGVVDGM